MKARLVSVQVQVNVLADDDQTLHPVQVPPLTISAGDWKHFAQHGITEVLADVQQQLDARAPGPDEHQAD